MQTKTAVALPRDMDADLDAWLKPFLDVTGRKTRRAMAPLYVRGLLGGGERKSIHFRRGLGKRGLAWAVGVACPQLVYPTTVRLRPSLTPTGRPAKHPVPSRPAGSVAALLEPQRWQRIPWRSGCKGPLSARFAALRVRVADGPRNADNTRLPGDGRGHCPRR